MVCHDLLRWFTVIYCMTLLQSERVGFIAQVNKYYVISEMRTIAKQQIYTMWVRL